MKKIIKRENGFTLIEVVLVLAIGALIILMALLAFTGAQRSRRDTARTNLVGQMQAAVEQYAANSGGDYPQASSFDSLKGTNSWKDPLLDAAGIASSGSVSTTKRIVYLRGASCASFSAGASTTTYAIRYLQESNQTVCKDNTK